jgi:hypothetical protein
MNNISFIGLVYSVALLLAMTVIFDMAALRGRTGQTSLPPRCGGKARRRRPSHNPSTVRR